VWIGYSGPCKLSDCEYNCRYEKTPESRHV
jgi:hypothetical protein